ncbi:MAG: ATP-binding protein, partial [Bdellovibrionales bacterium]
MSGLVNLLVIEDNPADADLIKEYLSEVTEFKANLVCVRTLREGKDFLKDNDVHAVLVDLSLPDSQGLETIRTVVSYTRAATAIVLTSLDDKEMALSAIESGAQDYILKNSLGPDALSRVIRYSIQRAKWQYKINEIQGQLYQSQKMESIGRLAGGIAHDFNNQLGAMTLLCGMIQEAVPAEHVVQKYTTQILSVTEKSADLIKRLLAFSRKQPAAFKVVDLSRILVESEKLLGKLLGADVQVKVVGDTGAFVRVDASMVEHALMNMAINARDAMPSGGSLTFAVAIEGEKVVLKVADTGVGISPEIIPKIFDPFFSTKPAGMGTGLGLSMVYGTVKQSDGEIFVESELGRGTTFTIILPYQADGASLIEKNEKVERSRETKVLGSGTILLVEDEEVLREATSAILTSSGYTVIEAKDGAQALKILK